MRCLIEVAVRRKPLGAARRNRTACAVLLIACLTLAPVSADGADDLAQTYATQTPSMDVGFHAYSHLEHFPAVTHLQI